METGLTTGKPDNAELTRARAREIDDIVADVLKQMADGTWVAGAGHRALMTKHGVDLKTVRGWAAQAGRIHRILRRVDREELVARNEARLDRIYAMALEKKTVVYTGHGDNREAEIVPQPDLKAAVSAIAEQGKLLGLNAPEKVQVSASNDYDTLTDEAKLAWVDERIAELQDERAKLVARMRIVET